MQLTGFSPGGEFGDDIELTEELTDDLAGVFALAELLDLLEDSGESVFGLRDRAFRVVLPLPFETLVMLEELFPEELCEALAGRTCQGSWLTWGVDGRQTTLESHQVRAHPV